MQGRPTEDEHFECPLTVSVFIEGDPQDQDPHCVIGISPTLGQGKPRKVSIHNVREREKNENSNIIDLRANYLPPYHPFSKYLLAYHPFSDTAIFCRSASRVSSKHHLPYSSPPSILLFLCYPTGSKLKLRFADNMTTATIKVAVFPNLECRFRSTLTS